MTAEQLRKSILQQAIEGKLVPQDPNDEPASVLLERIREEKARLIAEKKIKREKNPSIIYRADDNSHYEKFLATGEERCIDDELPFDLPKGWAWARLGELAQILGGYAFTSESLKSGFGTRVVRISDFQETGWVNKNIARYNGQEELSQYELQLNDLLLAMTGGTVGKSYLVESLPEKMYLNQRVAIIRSEYLHYKYLDFFIKSPFIAEYICSIKNSTNDNISMKDIVGFIFPLPPLAEQERIVARVEELMPLVEQYGKAETELRQLNSSIREQLKKSVLQHAIEGKLVPQRPEEGTAETLLAEIHAEKQRLYAEGKLKKRDLSHSTIYRAEDNKYYEQVGKETTGITAEIPYDLPNGWSFCRLRDLCSISTGATFKKEEATLTKEGIRILRGGNIQPFRFTYKDDDIFLPTNKVLENILLRENDIITPAVTSLDNIGKIARIDSDLSTTTVGGFVFILRPYGGRNMFSKLLLFFLSSPLLIEYMRHISNKSGQAFYNIGKERLGLALIPIPPKAEQERIISAIESIFSIIEGD